MILDTTVLHDLMRTDRDAVEAVEQLEVHGVPQRLSVTTLYELYWGVGYVDTAQSEKTKIDAVIGSKETYPVTPEIARKAGRLVGGLTRDGRALNDAGDELIGATAIVHDEPILTRNADHFGRIDDLEVLSY